MHVWLVVHPVSFVYRWDRRFEDGIVDEIVDGIVCLEVPLRRSFPSHQTWIVSFGSLLRLKEASPVLQ